MGRHVTPTHDVRRQAVILAADSGGQSDTLRAELLDSAFARHFGRTVKAIDSTVLAEFASVSDAVSCAVDVQRRRADAGLRIGIDLGELTGAGDAISGEALTMATRLAQM